MCRAPFDIPQYIPLVETETTPEYIEEVLPIQKQILDGLDAQLLCLVELVQTAEEGYCIEMVLRMGWRELSLRAALWQGSEENPPVPFGFSDAAGDHMLLSGVTGAPLAHVEWPVWSGFALRAHHLHKGIFLRGYLRDWIMTLSRGTLPGVYLGEINLIAQREEVY